MAADISLSANRRRPAGGDVCPVHLKSPRMERQSVFRWDKKFSEDRTPVSGGGITREESVAIETSESSEDELGRLDIDLDRNLSAVNTVKPPQFVDIDLEDDEDSSDEEYCPDDEEEEEDTAEETFLSDADSLASPLRAHHGPETRQSKDQRTDGAPQRSSGHLREQMTSTCAPAESSFLERLNAVEEELDSSPAYTFDQSLDREAAEDDDGDDEGCLAFRTRSKLRLVNVPLGQLEAELLAPDITADMYDLSVTQREEDRHWTKWLQGLMSSDNEEEAEDDDDPEYNFLDDIDEPDLEDYRTDRAVQITKREVNELLEELFDTLQEEEVAADEQEQEEVLSQIAPKFNVPQALRAAADGEEKVRSSAAEEGPTGRNQSSPHASVTAAKPVSPSLHLNSAQKLQLQQQIQQHVQLLTQVHLLSHRVDALNNESCLTKHYLMFLPSSFRVCNLQGALDLLQEVEQREEPPPAPAAPPAPRRLLPTMTPTTHSHAFPLLPAHTAWLFATRPSSSTQNYFLSAAWTLPSTSRTTGVCTLQEKTVLGLKHFEGVVQSDQLISSYLLCKNRWNFRKHVREMSGSKAPPNNIIKMFLTQQVVPPLPLACSRVQPGDQRPPVDRDMSNAPSWLKNSQQIIKKTQLDSNSYPPSLPPGCTLRLHPYWLNKTSRPPPPRHRRLFTLAHNASLLPLAKAPADRQVDVQPISFLTLAPPTTSGATPLTAVHPVPTHSVCTDIIQSCPSIGQSTQQSVSGQQNTLLPLLLPLPSLSSPDTTKAIVPCSPATVKPSCLLLQMMLTAPAPPTATSHHAPRQQLHGPIKEAQTSANEESSTLISALSHVLKEEEEVGQQEVEEQEEVEEQDWTVVSVVSLNGGDSTGEGEEEGREGGSTGGSGEEAGGGGEGEPGGEGEQGEEDEGQRENGGGEREEDGEKEKDEDHDRQGEEEEEEDFDDLTQDEDEEEVMSSASEESVLSVPELQETMKQLTWLAAERRLCTDGDSEEDHSPTSPALRRRRRRRRRRGLKGKSQARGGAVRQGGTRRRRWRRGLPEEEQGGRPRPLRGRSQQRRSKDAAKLLRLLDENILDNDPQRESKDMAFAQSYLSRVRGRTLAALDWAALSCINHLSVCPQVREALQDAPGQVEEFVSLLNDFEQVGEGQDMVLLFRQLRCILGDRTDLLRDFAAFLHPGQALQCGLVHVVFVVQLEEQQAFERSRRFLRQLEISFGDNPSHYQKIIRALQSSSDLSPGNITELKAQMATLLKGHTHLQTEFWVFFDELRPPPARPGQFEEAHWPEDGGGGIDGGDGVSQVSGGGAAGGFEEVTLPELEEEEEGHKIQPMTCRRQRRKMNIHRNYKDCDWSDKEWPCPCRDEKIRRHRRKGCSRCHGNKTSGGVSRAMKSLDPLYSQMNSAPGERGDKYLELKVDDDSALPDRSSASWEGSFRLTDEKEEEEEELDDEEDDEDEEERRNIDKEQRPAVKRSRREEAPPPPAPSSAPPRPSPPLDPPVCAKNISLTASGEKVILWTRYTPTPFPQLTNSMSLQTQRLQIQTRRSGPLVSRRFRDLMRLFRTAARQTSSEDEAPPTETAAANVEKDSHT
ncbi:hypothetical protein INR49_019670 [Caranx melampygus]|nr:hypothetical protein INR49_019670 [Caranx melampygus]